MCVLMHLNIWSVIVCTFVFLPCLDRPNGSSMICVEPVVPS